MGPGQAKQCQLRAFLTYYINDLFLNQVSLIQSLGLTLIFVPIFEYHHLFRWFYLMHRHFDITSRVHFNTK